MNIELTNMVMIQDPLTSQVIVQERIKSWPGISFPGGHIEDGESFVDSAIREVKEETGLVIKNLKSCGVIHWCNSQNFDRYIVYLYKTTEFTGKMTEETSEGKVFWTNIADIYNMKLSKDFDKYMPMFLSDEYSEAFGLWNDFEAWNIVYK